MNHRLVADAESRCIAVIWHGVVDQDAFRAYIADVVTVPGFAERRGVLHDFRHAEITAQLAELDDARRVQRRARPEDAPGRRMAALVSTALQFGMMRQILTMVVADDNLKVTYSEAEARAFTGLPGHVSLAPESPAGG